MPTLEELNAMLADPGFQERHKEFERQMYERLEPLGDAIQKMMKPTPPSRQDPDLMTEEELLAAFEAMPLPARQEAMKRALDEEMGPVAVMSPTSGVTSIPLGTTRSGLLTEQEALDMVGTDQHSPWPPLSREQVVKLHEALSAWMLDVDGDFAITTRPRDHLLYRTLRSMGIGSPPPTRTWTHEEVAKMAEEVQTFTDSQSDMDCILAMSAPGRTTVLATRSPYLWTPDGKFRAMSPGEVASIVEGADGKPTFRVTQDDAMPAGTDRDYLLAASAPDVPRRQEGQWEEPPKRNCWTCKHAGFKSSRYGYKYATCRSPVDGASYWVTKQILDGEEMPPKDSDGCPGWESKIVRHNCLGCAWRLEPNGEYPLGACLLPYSHAHREAKSAWLNSEAARVSPCPARKEVKPSDTVASLERWMKGGKP